MLDLEANVRRLMTPDPWAVRVGDSLTDVWTGMLNGGFHHVPVVSGERLVGMLSITDLAQVLRDVPTELRDTGVILDETSSVDKLMTHTVDTVPVSARVRDVVERFALGRYHAVPVVDGDVLVGIVTTTDLARALLA
jgi:CBS domain-containing protein